MAQVSALPQVSVQQWGIGDRAIGRLLNLDVDGRPADQPQADLAGDAFFGLWKPDPRMQAEIPLERTVNGALMQWIQAAPSWGATKSHTTSNIPASLTSSGLLWKALTDQKAIQAALKKQARADRAKQKAAVEQLKADACQELADDAEQPKPKRSAAKKRAAKAQERASALNQKAQDLATAAENMIDKAKDDRMIDTAVSSAVKQAEDEAKETDELLGGWGFDPGSDVFKDARAAVAFMKRRTERLAKIARMAGRMRGIALTARRARVAVGVTIGEVQPTKDLLHVFAGELAFLRPGAPAQLQALAAAKLADSGLIGYRLGGDAKQQGPFVAVVDVSGSMSCADAWGNERETVGKGIALGLAQTAKAEGRPYILGTFGSDHDKSFICQSSAGWQAHLDWAEKSRGGGTSFDKALSVIMEQLTALGKTAKGADAVIMSDGEALVSPEMAAKWRSFARETGARLLYVPTPVDCYSNSDQSLSRLADKVLPLDALDQQHGDDITRSIATWMR